MKPIDKMKYEDFSQEELYKCQDFVYFYNTYMRPENYPILTKAECDRILEEVEFLKSGGIKLRSRRYGHSYFKHIIEQPLTPEDCYETRK